MLELLAGCTKEQMKVFDGMARGHPVENYDPVLVQQLIDMNLLDNHSGYVMVPAMLWKLWKNDNAVTEARIIQKGQRANRRDNVVSLKGLSGQEIIDRID